MRISGIQSYHADGGWRPFSFLQMTADEGLVGWSEYACGPWAPALPQVIDALAGNILGRDPRGFAVLRDELRAITCFAPGGLNAQAISALENACIDLAAKAAGLSVHQLFGGALRDRIDLYWTHCGSFRARHPDLFEHLLGCERLSDLDAMKRLGAEVTARGFKAAKTNPLLFTADGPVLLNPGFVVQGLDRAGKLERATRQGIEDQVAAFRDGAGPSIDLMLDVNFAYTPEAVAQLERGLREFDLRWIEYDLHAPAALARLQRSMTTPLASLEAIYLSGGYKPYLDEGAVDIAVVDLLWNGFTESVRIAQLAQNCAINVAPHNFYGPLADLIAANYCAVVPNLQIMEFEGDDVPWKYELLEKAPVIEAGSMLIPTGLGWGAEVNLAAVEEHPWRPEP